MDRTTARGVELGPVACGSVPSLKDLPYPDEGA